MKTSVSIIILGLAIVLSTCTSEVYSPDVCFQENILPIFVSNCTMSGCHNGSGGGRGETRDYSNYDGIMTGIVSGHPQFSEIYSSISGNRPSMPKSPYPKLSAKDVSYLKIWIKMGAPNSSNCSSCDTSNYTYSGRVKPIITTWCVGCHQSTSTGGGGVDLSSYTGVVNSIGHNQLLGGIDHQAGFSPMPKNTNKLSSCDINAITKWINAGNPNN